MKPYNPSEYWGPCAPEVDFGKHPPFGKQGRFGFLPGKTSLRGLWWLWQIHRAKTWWRQKFPKKLPSYPQKWPPEQQNRNVEDLLREPHKKSPFKWKNFFTRD